MSNFFMKAMFVFWAYCLVSSALLNFAFSLAPYEMTNILRDIVSSI